MKQDKTSKLRCFLSKIISLILPKDIGYFLLLYNLKTGRVSTNSDMAPYLIEELLRNIHDKLKDSAIELPKGGNNE